MDWAVCWGRQPGRGAIGLMTEGTQSGYLSPAIIFKSSRNLTPSVLVSYGCCNTLPQAQRLNNTNLSLRSSGGQNSDVNLANLKMATELPSFLEALRGESVYLPCPASRGHPLALAHSLLPPASESTMLCLSDPSVVPSPSDHSQERFSTFKDSYG